MDMNNKIVMVTGATDGIGKTAAEALAKMGAHVVIVGRNRRKAEAVVKAIKTATGKDNAEFIIADLSSIAEIRKAADMFKERHEKLHVLLNNAGAVFTERKVSVDGYEMTLALNHLNYFLLTHQLLDVIKATAAENGEARIINVSSGAHQSARNGINFDDLQREMRYRGLQVYGESKMMNILFTFELARRLAGTGVTANVLHPGFVNTGFGHNNGGLVSMFMSLIQPLFAMSPEKGAETSIYLASSPEVEGVTGKYFENSKEKQPIDYAYDERAQKRLWDISMELTGLSEEESVASS